MLQYQNKEVFSLSVFSINLFVRHVSFVRTARKNKDIRLHPRLLQQQSMITNGWQDDSHRAFVESYKLSIGVLP